MYNKSAINEKPNLFFNINDIPRLREKVKYGWLKEAYEVMLAKADYFMNDDNKPLEFKREDGTIPQISFRALEYKVGTLALTGYLTGDNNYFNQAIKILFAFINNNYVEYFLKKGYHLLLGDGGRALSTCYDWLYPYLSDAQKQIVREKIIKIGTWLFESKTTWGRPHSGVQSCNHNSVHYGGLGLCSLVLGEHDEWLERAINQVRLYFDKSTDSTGYITEGVSYGNYGLQGACTFAIALQRRSGIDLIGEHEKTKFVINQFINHLLPGYRDLLASNDNSHSIGNAAPLMYLISRFRHRVGLHMFQKHLGMNGDCSYGGGRDGNLGSGLSLPLVIIWSDETLEPQDPISAKYPLSTHFECGRVFTRNKWEDNLASFVSFRAGFDYHRGHNHNDQCSFTFYSKGEEFLIDPGIMLNLSESHNLVLVNGLGQRGGSCGNIEKYEESDRSVFISGDSTEAYVWEGLLVGFARRNILFVKGERPYLVVVDDIQTENDMENVYSWMMHTTTDNKFHIIDNNTVQIVGSKRGATCQVKFINPSNIVIKETDFGDRTITRYVGTSYYKELVKEAYAEVKALNPHFITIISSADVGELHPEIKFSGDINNMNVTLRFGDDYEEQVLITEDSIQLV